MNKLHYIDLFCGAGGTTTGVEQAMFQDQKCAHVIACVNHDPHAIASHLANHPDSIHFTEDIRTLNVSPIVSLGFPKDYKLLGTKNENKKYIGNAVECGMARQLCETLYNRIYA